MIARYLRAIALGILCCLLSVQAHAEIATSETGISIALQSVTVGERGTDLLLRFNRPISHVRSWLSVIHDGRVVETIHFRLQSAPNVLFARIRTPAPGDYVVRWSVCPEGSDDRYEGEFPFTVRPVTANNRTPEVLRSLDAQ
jgi:hypothetical protein